MSQKPATKRSQTTHNARPATTDALSRSSIARRLPVNLRTRLDEAILLRPKGLPTLEAIAAHFDLARYRISPAALRAYARRLDALARPVVTGQILAFILGCLPRRYRRRVLAGTESLLLARFTQALSADRSTPLPVADLARLGSVLSAMTRPRPSRRDPKTIRTHGKLSSETRGEMQTAKFQAVVRDLYGLRLPAPSRESASLASPETAPALSPAPA